MHLCFIIEARYRDDSMPRAVATHLAERGHAIELLEPLASVTCLSRLATKGFDEFDAFVLKTVSNGPGLSILEAAGASGIATVNHWRSIRLVRDKAVALAHARAHGLPFPVTYFLAEPQLLEAIPRRHYPLVVKPADGSLCEHVHLLRDPGDVASLPLEELGRRAFLAQRYVENDGWDVKLYHTGRQLYATVRRSCLHPDADVRERVIPVTRGLADIARRVALAFGLNVFGVDLIRSRRGWVGVDINDFPSFGLVPSAVAEIGETVVRAAAEAAATHTGRRRVSAGIVLPRRLRARRQIVLRSSPA
jgi:ribosomal protein S6--L-glutamate ligase